tara:strand:+ start:138 stop:386 length:249 start_codon:yes stop_codon:yes gene_type:complete
MKQKYCFTKVPELTADGMFKDKWRVAKVVENEPGYTPLGTKDPYFFVGSAEYVEKIVNAWNEKLGVNLDREQEIVISTMEVK